MFRLWLMLELTNIQKKSKSKLISYAKLAGVYILPTLIAIIGVIQENNELLSPETIGIAISFSNLIIICITHYLINIYFFNRLENDVIIKFLPDRMDEYIKVRLVMILIKWNLPFTMASIFSFKKIVEIPNSAFFLFSIIIIISWFIINYLIAIYLRYFLSIVDGKLENIIKAIGFISVILALMILPQFIVITLLDEMALNLGNYNRIQYININIFHMLMIILIFILSLAILKFTDNNLKVRIRKIITIKGNNNKFKRSITVERFLKRVIKLVSRNLSATEYNVLIKDMKGFIRDNKFSLALILGVEIFINVFMVYIFLSIEINDFSSCIELFISIDIVLFIFMIFLCLMAGLGLRDILQTDKDIEILEKYNIKIKKENLIKSKRKLVSIFLFYPSFIFYIVAFVSRINLLSWYGLLLSFLPIIIIEKLISLLLVRHINKEESTYIILKIINMSLIGLICILFLQFLNGKSHNITNSLILWGFVNLTLMICYLFNTHIDKIKKVFKINK